MPEHDPTTRMDTVLSIYEDEDGESQWQPVDQYLEMIRAACADAEARGWTELVFTGCCIEGKRPETDGERDARLAMARQERARMASIAKRTEDDERAVLERLKAKYEAQGMQPSSNGQNGGE